MYWRAGEEPRKEMDIAKPTHSWGKWSSRERWEQSAVQGEEPAMRSRDRSEMSC